MSRALTADHILFDECVEAFRPSDHRQGFFKEGKSSSYLLASFELPEPWQLPHCLVHRSVRVPMAFGIEAFVCRVENPDWVGRFNPHRYAIALASIASF